jgi:ribonuclease HI
MQQSRITEFFPTTPTASSASSASTSQTGIIDNPLEMYALFFDGGSRGNPGNSGSGSLLLSPTRVVLWENATNHGIQTNNYAEYQGLLIGMKKAIELGIKNIIIRGDSLLVIQQVRGVFKCKHPNILPLYQECCKLRKCFTNCVLEHIPRKMNGDADRLSNIAMDNPLH